MDHKQPQRHQDGPSGRDGQDLDATRVQPGAGRPDGDQVHFQDQETQLLDAEYLSTHLRAEPAQVDDGTGYTEPAEDQGQAPDEPAPPASGQRDTRAGLRPADAVPAADDDETTIQPPEPGLGELPSRPLPDEALQPAMSVGDPHGEFAVASTPQVQAGEVFADRYRLEQQLAQRGGTLTWRAFDQKLSRSVLVHVMGANDPRTADVLEAARKAAFATDSRFLRVLDAVSGQEPGEPSLVVCEFAPGESLEKLLRQGPLSALEAAWVARELADAMGAMHAEGLFHQRLNHDTVIITATGNVKIVGFLIEAAMYPDDEGGPLAWSEREHADVTAIGKLLYACLVTRWPTARDQLLGPDGTPRSTWGLNPAPMDARGWLTPRQIRSGVSPALDVICDQILSDAPRHNEMPLRSASQVTLALAKVLGTADAAADLERRLRYPVLPVGEPDVAPPEPPGLDTTARMQAVRPDDGRPDSAVQPATPASDDADELADSPGMTPSKAQAIAARRRDPRYRPAPRRWLALLAALVLISVLVGLVRVVYHQVSDDQGGGSGQQAQGAGDVLELASAAAFDPASDGGNSQENSDDAGKAVDGDVNTAWTTVTYLNDPKLGRLKPGVGLVVDLGERRRVGSVRLTLKGTPTGVQLRVPADTGVDKAPTSSAKQWTTLTSATASGSELTLTPQQQVESRFVLVYLTSLPRTSGNKYQGAVAEIEVRS